MTLPAKKYVPWKTREYRGTFISYLAFFGIMGLLALGWVYLVNDRVFEGMFTWTVENIVILVGTVAFIMTVCHLLGYRKSRDTVFRG